MYYPPEFEDIRPYNDSEFLPAMQRIVQHPAFEPLAAFVYPQMQAQEVRDKMLSYGNIHDFQHTVMLDALHRVIQTSMTSYTYSGEQNIDPSSSYIFVSNHRDIVLDTFLLQQIVHNIGMDSTHITFGANLMSDPWIVDIGKINKMFKVVRGGTPKQFYREMSLVSRYIRHIVTNMNQCVWIAQRNGRTKNGIDTTEVSLIKMLAMSGSSRSAVQNLADVRIVPVAVSYEWEPCDELKARELSLNTDGSYRKQPGEDMHSVIHGLTQQKGNVHLSICKPVTADDLAHANLDGAKDDIYQYASQLIDRRIHENYRLTPNNYIAHDLRSHSDRYSDHYTEQQREQFLQRLLRFRQSLSENPAGPDAEKIFIDIYANPISTSC